MAENNRTGQEFEDRNFNPELRERYQLSFEISTYGAAYCIYDHEINRFVFFKRKDWQGLISPSLVGRELTLFLENSDLPDINFKKVNFLIRSAGNVIVPATFYDENEKKSYLRYQSPVEKNFMVMADNLPAVNAFNVYKVHENTYDAISNLFKNAVILHYSTSLLTGLISMFKNRITNYAAFINLGQTFFDLVILDQKGLVFFNSFKYKSAEDIIYYILFVFEQYKLKQAETETYVMGEVERDSKVFERIYKYIKNISFLGRNKEFEYSYALDGIKEHYYFSLFNSELCG